MKELPGDIKTSKDVDAKKSNTMSFDEWRHRYDGPRVFGDEGYSDEENGRYYWDLHKRYNEYLTKQKVPIIGLESEAWVTDKVEEN